MGGGWSRASRLLCRAIKHRPPRCLPSRIPAAATAAAVAAAVFPLSTCFVWTVTYTLPAGSKLAEKSISGFCAQYPGSLCYSLRELPPRKASFPRGVLSKDMAATAVLRCSHDIPCVAHHHACFRPGFCSAMTAIFPFTPMTIAKRKHHREQRSYRHLTTMPMLFVTCKGHGRRERVAEGVARKLRLHPRRTAEGECLPTLRHDVVCSRRMIKYTEIAGIQDVTPCAQFLASLVATRSSEASQYCTEDPNIFRKGIYNTFGALSCLPADISGGLS